MVDTKKLRILIHSNSPLGIAAYATQTDAISSRLTKTLGHEVLVSAYYGLQGAPMAHGDVIILPGGRDAYGGDSLIPHALHNNVDIIIAFLDLWVLDPSIVAHSNRLYAYSPVDHEPLVDELANNFRLSRGVISFSKFAQRVCKDAGIDSFYVPHCVDTEIFQPRDRAETRARMKVTEDVFVAGIVAANKSADSRKAFDQQIRAFAEFNKRHPDSVLYLHTELTRKGGENIPKILDMSGVPMSAVRVVDQYAYRFGIIGQEHMSHVYSGMDVLLNATCGEGFGLPIIEAQSCGVPAITTNFSSMPELTISGWCTDYLDKKFMGGTYQAIPSVAAISDALEKAYRSSKRKDIADLRKDTRKGIMQYDADYVTERFWKPVLNKIAISLEEDPPLDYGQRSIVQELDSQHHDRKNKIELDESN